MLEIDAVLDQTYRPRKAVRQLVANISNAVNPEPENQPAQGQIETSTEEVNRLRELGQTATSNQMPVEWLLDSVLPSSEEELGEDF
jgi:hypothetical protein